MLERGFAADTYCSVEERLGATAESSDGRHLSRQGGRTSTRRDDPPTSLRAGCRRDI